MEADQGHNKMGVEMISTDKIKPTLIIRAGGGGGGTEKLDDDAFKLCFIDQFMIRTYFGIVIFYPPPPPATDNNNNNKEDVVKQLKATLSIALNTFYPLSGRVKGNLTVDDFQAGVPFTETRVKGYDSLAEFLKSPNMEFLNHLSPVETFALTTTYDEPQPPPLVVQVNIFPCGGIALGLCFNHQLADGATADAFLKTWANARHTPPSHPISSEASSVFPPRQSIPPELAYAVDNTYRRNCKTSTKRFVFDSNSIAALKSSSTSSQIQNPSRTEAVLAFICKSIMESAPTPTLTPQLLTLGVNLRFRMKQQLDLKHFSFGNLVCMAGAPLSSTHDHDNDNDNEMGHLVQLIRTGVASIDDNYIDFISSSTEEAFQAMVDGVEKFRDLGSQLLTTSSWIRFCFSDADFGFGKPVWTSVLGEATANYPIYNDLVILTELLPHPSNSNNTTTATTAAARGIEAWVRLDVEVMKLLEQNSNFLQFASLNPPILF
ncbi:Stemmadenine O-acetyltransferase [Linum grandiflorum]